MIAVGGIALGILADLISSRGAIEFGASMAVMMSLFLRARFRTPE